MKAKKILSIVLCVAMITVFGGCNLKEIVEKHEQENIIAVNDIERMMYYGIMNDNFSMVDYALENGADISNLSEEFYMGSGIGYGNTVHEAIEVNSFPNWSMLRYLIDHGADTNYTVDPILNISMLIGKIKNKSVLELESAIILAEAPQTDINAEDTSWHNALFWAVDIAVNNEDADMYLRLISTLIEHDAEVNDDTLMQALNPSYITDKSYYDYAGSNGLYPMTKMVVEAADKQGVKFPYSDILHDAIIGDTESVFEKVKIGELEKLDIEAEQRAVLFYTAAYGSIDTLKLVMEKGDYNFDVERLNGNLICPALLDAAALGNNTEMIEYLIQNGADVNHIDSNNMTPIYRAVQFSNYDAVKILLKNHAVLYSTGTTEFDYGMVEKNSYSNFVFEEIANNQDTHMLEILLENGYDFSEMELEYSDESGETHWDRFAQNAYEAAIERDRLSELTEFYRILIEKTDKSADDLVVYGDMECCKVLVENGYQPSEHPEQLLNVVNDAECIKYLICNGGDVNASAPDKSIGEIESSLLLNNAVRYGYFDTVKYLIENGADINAVDRSYSCGNSPLHCAILSTSEILNYLIENGTDLNTVDNFGNTPVMIAVQYRLKDYVELLVANGADTSIKNSDGKTALDIANESNDKELVRLLS